MGRFSLARKLATSLLVAFLVGAVTAGVVRLRPTPQPDDPEHPRASSVAVVDRLEAMVFDALARRDAARRTVSPDLVLITIDEASVKRAREQAGGWPWSRQFLGALVVELRTLGAKLVVLDAAFADPSRLPDDDARFARQIDLAGAVVAGFTFADSPEEGIIEPGRWAILQGSYATRGAALLAAGPLMAGGARPYLVVGGERLEVWLGGYRDHAAAAHDADRLRGTLGLGTKDSPTLRELNAEESLDRVTVDLLFAERNAISFAGGTTPEMKTFLTLEPPVAELAASVAGFGNLRLERDQDGAVRGVRHLWRHEGRYYPSLALAAAMALTGEKRVFLEGGRLRLGALAVPVDAHGVTRLRFYGRAETEGAPESPYPVIPVLSVVRSAERRATGKSLDDKLAARLKDKIAFVSFDVAACERTETPTVRSSLAASAWASALDNLLRSDGLLRASADEDAAVAFVMALLGALVSLLYTRGPHPRRTVMFVVAAAALVSVGYLTWMWRSYSAGLWVGAVIPLLAFVVTLVGATAANYADERQAMGHIREAMGRYALPTLVEQLLRRPHHLELAGERRHLTAMVCDLKGFTLAADGMSPKDVMTLLNEYMAEVQQATAATRGNVDRMSATMAVVYWGAPLPNARHALDACRCALKLRARLEARLPAWKELVKADLAIRLGVCTGDLLVGKLSGQGGVRARFAAFGPAMDTASWLARANDGLSTTVLVGEATYEAVLEEVATREVDLLRMPNRPRPLRALELRALKREQTEADRIFCDRFEQAVVAFRRRDFKVALAAFEMLAKEHPTDRPTALYLDRCYAYLALPPGDEWDGVYVPRG